MYFNHIKACILCLLNCFGDSIILDFPLIQYLCLVCWGCWGTNEITKYFKQLQSHKWLQQTGCLAQKEVNGLRGKKPMRSDVAFHCQQTAWCLSQVLRLLRTVHILPSLTPSCSGISWRDVQGVVDENKIEYFLQLIVSHLPSGGRSGPTRSSLLAWTLSELLAFQYIFSWI